MNSKDSKAMALFRSTPTAPASLHGMTGESKGSMVIRERGQESWNLQTAKGALALHAQEISDSVHYDAEKRIRSFVRHVAEEQNEAWTARNGYAHTEDLEWWIYQLEEKMSDWIIQNKGLGTMQILQALNVELNNIMHRELLPNEVENGKRRRGFLP